MVYTNPDWDGEKGEPTHRFALEFTEQYLNKYLFEGKEIRHIQHDRSRGIVRFVLDDGRWEVPEAQECPVDSVMAERIAGRLAKNV